MIKCEKDQNGEYQINIDSEDGDTLIHEMSALLTAVSSVVDESIRDIGEYVIKIAESKTPRFNKVGEQ